MMLGFLFWMTKTLLYVLLPAICIASLTPGGRYYVWSGVYIGCLAIIGSLGAVAAIPMYLMGRKYDVNWLVARSFYAFSSPILGWNIELEGAEHFESRPSIIVCNHQSMVDILFLGRFFPKQSSIMAKKEIQFVPMLGPFMTLSGAIFIDRGNSVKAQQSLNNAGEAMKARGTSLFMFPEGTRHNAPKAGLLPFKKGAFFLAVQAGIPVVPVVVENYWKFYHKGVFGAGTIKVKVLPPVPTTGLTSTDVGALTERVREQMLAVLLELSHEPTAAKTVEPVVPVSQDTQAPPVLNRLLDVKPVVTAVPSADTVVPPTASPSASLNLAPSESSENGTDDDDMVIVGRPAAK